MASSLQNTQEELDRRKTTINNIDNYITLNNVWLDESIQQLGFTKEHLLQKVLRQSRFQVLTTLLRINWMTYLYIN